MMLAAGADALDRPTVEPHTYDGAACDLELIARVGRGDEAALGAIYDRYHRLIYTVALRVAGDQSTAEEIVEDVFHTVWRSAGTFQAGGSLASWLMCITRQRAIDATRSQVHGSRAREALLIEHILADTGGDRSGLILQQSVRAALADLSQQQRQALDLAYYGGRTERQIAECLGTPIGTVKSHLRVALLKLRDSLARIDAH